MTQANASQIGEATVRITADTAPLKAGIAEAKAETAALGEETAASAAAGSDSLLGMAASAGAYALAAIAAAKATVEAFDAIDNAINGKSDFDINAPTGFVAQIRAIKEEAKSLQESAIDRSFLTRVRDFAEQFTGNQFNFRQQDINAANEKQNEAARLEAARTLREKESQQKKENEQRSENLAAQIEKERIAELEGAERIAAQRQAAIAEARKKYGGDADELIDQINRRYDAETKRAEELEARRSQLESERQQREVDRAQAAAAAFSKEVGELLEANARNIAGIIKGASDQFKNAFAIEKIQASLDQIAGTIGLIARRDS